MNLIDGLLGEHGLLYTLLADLEDAIGRARGLAELRMVARPVRAALLAHARAEDELLLPALDKRLGPQGPILHSEHQEIGDTFRSLYRVTDPAAAITRLRHVIEHAREHFRSEEQQIFKIALDTISPKRLRQLGADWARMRGVFVAAADPDTVESDFTGDTPTADLL